MITAGTCIVVCDPDLTDRYIAECVEDVADERKLNPMVQVFYMIKYPIQHAIIYPDMAKENPPITPDMTCRMKYVKTASPSTVTLARSIGYEASMQKALAKALHDARWKAVLADHPFVMAQPGYSKVSPEEIAILQRHTKGCIQGRRAVLTKRAW